MSSGQAAVLVVVLGLLMGSAFVTMRYAGEAAYLTWRRRRATRRVDVLQQLEDAEWAQLMAAVNPDEQPEVSPPPRSSARTVVPARTTRTTSPTGTAAAVTPTPAGRTVSPAGSRHD